MEQVFKNLVTETTATLASESIPPTDIGNYAEAKARLEAKKGAPRQTSGLGLVGLEWEDDLPRAA